MISARDEILARVRAALADSPPPEPDAPAGYRREDPRGADELLTLLAVRVADYGARVHHTSAEGLGETVAAACAARGTRRIVVPGDLPRAWVPPPLEVVPDDGLSAGELDAVNGVVTACALAIAETGTLVLDGGQAQGRRALTLLPDHHVCVVPADRIVANVPQAIAALRGAVVDRGSPLTLISGPSATSDIELRRVEGVHGPRRLDVVLVTGLSWG